MVRKYSNNILFCPYFVGQNTDTNMTSAGINTEVEFMSLKVINNSTDIYYSTESKLFVIRII